MIWEITGARILACTLVLVGIWVLVRLRSARQKPEPKESKLTYNGDTLVVLVKGLGSSLYIQDVAAAVHEELPGADIFQPSFDSRLWSKQDVVKLSEDIAERINAALDERKKHGDKLPYKRIILIGHSIGALIVRAVYLISQDYRFSPLAIDNNWKWPRVERIIMLSGLGAGWSTPTIAKVGLRSIVFHLMVFWARLAGKATFMLSVRAGASFVADLRCHWLDLAAADRLKVAAGASSEMPMTIQVEGDRDGLVTGEDIRDYDSRENFRYFKMLDTEHFNVGVFTEASAQAIVRYEKSKGFTNVLYRWLTKERTRSQQVMSARRGRFVYTLTDTDPSGGSLPTAAKDLTAKRVVWVLHGIRDPGNWTGALAKAIEAEGKDVRGVAKSYGLFSLFEFLAPFTRRSKVEWFMKAYVGLRADYPNAVIDIVAHSFGTYLVCKALRVHLACRFGRVALAGSVVQRNFDWNGLGQSGRVEQIRNYQGSGDLIVGCLPGIWEYPPWRWLTKWRDLFGSAGFLGFTEGQSRYFTQVIVKGGHGAALVKTNHPSIKDFILRGDETEPNPKSEATASTATALLLFALGIVFLVATGWLLWPYGLIARTVYVALIAVILVYY